MQSPTWRLESLPPYFFPESYGLLVSGNFPKREREPEVNGPTRKFDNSWQPFFLLDPTSRTRQNPSSILARFAGLNHYVKLKVEMGVVVVVELLLVWLL